MVIYLCTALTRIRYELHSDVFYSIFCIDWSGRGGGGSPRLGPYLWAHLDSIKSFAFFMLGGGFVYCSRPFLSTILCVGGGDIVYCSRSFLSTFLCVCEGGRYRCLLQQTIFVYLSVFVCVGWGLRLLQQTIFVYLCVCVCVCGGGGGGKH
jgi:hypothetical protein